MPSTDDLCHLGPNAGNGSLNSDSNSWSSHMPTWGLYLKMQRQQHRYAIRSFTRGLIWLMPLHGGPTCLYPPIQCGPWLEMLKVKQLARNKHNSACSSDAIAHLQGRNASQGRPCRGQVVGGISTFCCDALEGLIEAVVHLRVRTAISVLQRFCKLSFSIFACLHGLP